MFLHLSVCSGGVGFPACITGHMTKIQGGGLYPRGLPTGGWAERPPPLGTRKAGGTHPIGMLSCHIYFGWGIWHRPLMYHYICQVHVQKASFLMAMMMLPAPADMPICWDSVKTMLLFGPFLPSSTTSVYCVYWLRLRSDVNKKTCGIWHLPLTGNPRTVPGVVVKIPNTCTHKNRV